MMPCSGSTLIGVIGIHIYKWSICDSHINLHALAVMQVIWSFREIIIIKYSWKTTTIIIFSYWLGIKINTLGISMSSNYKFSVHIASLRSIMLNVNESRISCQNVYFVNVDRVTLKTMTLSNFMQPSTKLNGWPKHVFVFDDQLNKYQDIWFWQLIKHLLFWFSL